MLVHALSGESLCNKKSLEQSGVFMEALGDAIVAPKAENPLQNKVMHSANLLRTL